jgi:trk system potassium uptake protein TrkH
MFGIHASFHVLGWVVLLVGSMLLIPTAADLAYGSDDWIGFARTAVIAGFMGVLIILSTLASRPQKLNFRQAFLIITIGWILVALIGAIPFLAVGISFSDAIFETMSGITTTGSTVLTNLDTLSPGILLWRSILQWIGGIGIIAIAVLILPFLRIGGMQLFKIESSGTDADNMGSTMRTALVLGGIYTALTMTCALVYFLLGMSGFDAVTHAMTTLSTGGFSTHDASFSFFKEPSLHWAATFFMICGALPFILFVKMTMGNLRALFLDQQVRAFLLFLAFSSIAMAFWLMVHQDIGLFTAITLTSFNITSVVTTTGYASADYTAWGPGAVGAFLVLMFIGGCSGSTSGAVKIYRYQVLVIFVRAHLKRLFSPNRSIPLKYNGQILPVEVPMSVLAFLSVFVATIAFFTVVLSMMGLDIVTAYSASVTAISNVGPGMGTIIGPAGNFQALPEPAIWALTVAMLAGRLEILTLLVMFDRDFWRL